MSDRRRLIGVIALSGTNALKLGLQIMVLPIMARILGPEAFGTVGLAMPFVLLANMVCDAGMGAALVRHPNPPRELESTVFWLSVGIGLTMTLLLVGASGPISDIYGHPELAPVLATLALILMVSSSLSVANSRIVRSGHFSLFAIGDLASAILSAAAAITAALNGWGAWALVVQQLVLWLTKMAWIFPVSKFRPAFYCRPALARDYLKFGASAVGANISDFIGKNAPTLVIGAFLGVTKTGFYTVAQQLNRIPDQVISGPIWMSTFSGIAAVHEDRAAARAVALRSLRIIMLGLMPVFCGLILVADVAVSVILGDQWTRTAWTLARLAPAGFLLCLYSFMGAVLMGMGQPGKNFRLTLSLGIAMTAGAAFGAQFDTVRAAALGIVGGALILSPFYLRAFIRELDVKARDLGPVVIPPLVATTVMAGVVLGVRYETAELSHLAQLLLSMLAGAITFTTVLLAVAGRQILRDLKTLAGRRAAAAPPLAE